MLPYSDKEGVSYVADRVREGIKRFLSERETLINKLNLNTGLAAFPDDGSDEETLINKARNVRTLFDEVR
jgi:GGDEF domain-containing protein